MATIVGQFHVQPEHAVPRDDANLASTWPGRWGGRGACLLASDAGALATYPAARLAVAADVRLDDRSTLCQSLGRRADDMSDAELVLAAYERWGRDCVDRLTGDFAIAIWDEERRELFCARDVFGVVPLYYRHDRNGLAVATKLAALWRPEDSVNNGRIASYLTGLDDAADETAFLPIRRLPAGHWLRWSGGDRAIGRHATIEPAASEPGESHAASIRQRFLDAVDDRARSVPNLGAMLSGGLDSSSIVAAATRHRDRHLRTFSFGYRKGSAFDEGEYVNAVIGHCPVTPDFVPMDDLAPLDRLSDLASGRDDLLFGPGLPKIARLLERARQAGVSVILDGHGGDEVVSHGLGRLNELTRQRRWWTLYRELRGVSAISNESAASMFMRCFASQGGLARARRRLRARQQRRRSTPVLDREFARTTDVELRMEHWAADYARAASTEAFLHLWNVTAPSVATAFEALRRVSDQVGVTLRFPFYDRRLVEYALTVPEHEKLRNGWTRHVMRQAMKDLLPEAVRWRRTKIDFGTELSVGLVRHHAPFLSDMLRSSGPLSGVVDLPAARHSLERLIGAPGRMVAADALSLWRMAYLTLWFSNRTSTAQPAMERS